MDNQNLRRRLATVDALLSKISVSGDALMLLAVARQELANAFKEIDNSTEVTDHG